jgi:hypothetical protein
MQDSKFQIAFDFDGKPYSGWVSATGEVNEKGQPTTFNVELNDKPFGEISFSNCKWLGLDERPAGLVKLLGKQIEKHFQL